MADGVDFVDDVDRVDGGGVNMRRLKKAIEALEGYDCEGPGLTNGDLVGVRFLLWRGVGRIRTSMDKKGGQGEA